MSQPQKFHDTGYITGVLNFTLWAYFATVVLSAYFSSIESVMWERIALGKDVASEDLARYDLLYSGISKLELVVTVAFAVLFLRWIYLSKRNARLLVGDSLEYTPGWAVGWFFVPIWGLWKPYQSLCETFRASHPDYRDNWQQAPRPAILPVWWGLWILSLVGDFGLVTDTIYAETAFEMMDVSRKMTANSVLEIPVTLATFFVIGPLWKWQLAKNSAVSAVLGP